jgi:hypothetical protein
MKSDLSKHAPKNEFDFEADKRRNNHTCARNEIQKLINISPQNAEDFLDIYRKLVGSPTHYWHSGLLALHMNTVAEYHVNFINGLVTLDNALQANKNLSPSKAYDLLRSHFNKDIGTGYDGVSGASTNVITEILHSYNNDLYAVMNSNSVNAMTLVDVNIFDESPNLTNTNGALYEDFCNETRRVCTALQLNNFSEFDAVGNYAYW